MTEVWLFDVAPPTREALARVATVHDVDQPEALHPNVEVVVIGAGTADPVGAVQRVRERAPEVGIVLLSPPERVAETRQALLFSPFIGKNVRCVDASDPAAVAEAVIAAAERHRAQRAHQGALDVARQQLRASLPAIHPNGELLSRLLQHVPIGVIAADADWRIVVCNPAAAALLETPQTAATGRLLTDWFADDTALLRHLDAALRATTPPMRHDMRDRVVEVSATPLTQGRAGSRAIVLLQDVTAQVRAEEERARLEAAVQQGRHLESLGLLAGGVAHDFNNLLTGVLGYTELAARDVPPSGRAAYCLRQIEVAARQASELTRAMLAYSGRGQMVVEAVDLSALVREIAHFVEAIISKKAQLRYELEDDLPPVRGDASQLRQIVMNLVTNASEALAGHPGTIRVATGAEELGPDELPRLGGDALPGGTYVWIEVEDDGVGMDESTRARIFDPFYTTKFTGRGLGLAATLGILRGHEGSVLVDSVPGRGSRFRVYLPADPEAPTSVAKRAGTSAWKAHGTVLIVDDEPAVRDVARLVLEEQGLEVVVASDGEDALEMARAHLDRIRLVLLDLTMPRLDGHETLVRLRALRSDLAVLVWSGFDEKDAQERFGSERVDGFLQKPFTPDQLVDAVRQLMSGG